MSIPWVVYMTGSGPSMQVSRGKTWTQKWLYCMWRSRNAKWRDHWSREYRTRTEKTTALGSKGHTSVTIETWQVMRTRKKSGRNKLGEQLSIHMLTWHRHMDTWLTEEMRDTEGNKSGMTRQLDLNWSTGDKSLLKYRKWRNMESQTEARRPQWKQESLGTQRIQNKTQNWSRWGSAHLLRLKYQYW